MSAVPADAPGARRERIRAERVELWRTVVVGSAFVVVPIGTCFAAPDLAPLFGAAAVAVLLAVALLARRSWRRLRVRADESSAGVRAVLERSVAFYGALEPEEARRFREEVELFLLEKRIVGVGAPVDDEIRVLVAASAVIPVFGFPGWRWRRVREVLLYGGPFSPNFRGTEAERESERKDAVGAVGEYEMRGTVILTRRQLELAFARARDGEHVGIHEFAHLVDWVDGTIDGTPRISLRHAECAAWVELVRKEMLRIDAGRSLLDRYALTSSAEFFAVASEVFFEKPDALRERHRELYEMLSGIYRQRTHELSFSTLREVVLLPRSARNAPCPCGSGKKLKRCCAA